MTGLEPTWRDGWAGECGWLVGWLVGLLLRRFICCRTNVGSVQAAALAWFRRICESCVFMMEFLEPPAVSQTRGEGDRRSVSQRGR